MQSEIFLVKSQTDKLSDITYFLMAFSSTPLSLSEDFCTQSYSADDMVVPAMSYICIRSEFHTM